MAELLAFTQSSLFGGTDSVLIELVRAWPKNDRWNVVIDRGHPGRTAYQEALAGRARLLVEDAHVGRLRAAFAAVHPDAVLVFSGGFPPTGPTVRALLAARLAGVSRRVLTVHNYPNLGSGLRALWRAGRGRLSVELCGAVISVSQDCAGKIAAACGRPVRTIYNGLSSAIHAEDPAALRRELGVPEAMPLIGAIGNLEERKGFRVLLGAFRHLAIKRPNVQLAIIGAAAEPAEEAALRTLAADPALSDRVYLIGFKPQAGRFAAAFDICVVPSLYFESFSLSALDAMRAGRPVAASRVGGLREVVSEDETGLLVEPGDMNALANALETLLDDPEKAWALGEAGARRAQERFSATRMAGEYREVLLGIPPHSMGATYQPTDMVE